MTVLRSTALVNAPAPTVGGALRHTRTAERGLASLGVRGRAVTHSAALLVPGDEMAFRLGPCTLRTRILQADATGLSSVLVGGPRDRSPLRGLWHDTVLAAVGSRTLITETVRWESFGGPLGRIADVVLFRRFVLSVLARRLAAVRSLAESWATRPVVVGTAIVHNGRLLAQQRRYPTQDAGRWELPGGRVEPGEDEQDAVVRECKEEMEIAVRPTGRVGTDVPLDNGMVLRIHSAELADTANAPKAVEHRAVRWVNTGELADLDWLDADRVLVHSLRALLG